MNQEILDILYEQGPRTIEQLYDIILCDLSIICEHVAFLVVSKQVYLDAAGVVWFAQEVAA